MVGSDAYLAAFAFVDDRRQILMQHVFGVSQQQIAGTVSRADKDVGYGPAVEPLEDYVKASVIVELSTACDFGEAFKRTGHILQYPLAVKTAEEALVAVQSEHHSVIPGTDLDCDCFRIDGSVVEQIPEVVVHRCYLDVWDQGPFCQQIGAEQIVGAFGY